MQRCRPRPAGFPRTVDREDSLFARVTVPSADQLSTRVASRSLASLSSSDLLEDAVLWNPSGKIEDLGSLANAIESNANGINNVGQVVGYALMSVSVYHAFVWSETAGTQDLNDLISANSGWRLEFAFAINDGGQITGRGLINGKDRAFLLTPVGSGDRQADASD